MGRYVAANPKPKSQRAKPPRLDRKGRELVARAGAEAELIAWTLRRHGMPPMTLGRKVTIERPLPARTPRVAVAV